MMGFKNILLSIGSYLKTLRLKEWEGILSDLPNYKEVYGDSRKETVTFTEVKL